MYKKIRETIKNCKFVTFSRGGYYPNRTHVYLAKALNGDKGIEWHDERQPPTAAVYCVARAKHRRRHFTERRKVVYRCTSACAFVGGFYPHRNRWWARPAPWPIDTVLYRYSAVADACIGVAFHPRPAIARHADARAIKFYAYIRPKRV